MERTAETDVAATECRCDACGAFKSVLNSHHLEVLSEAPEKILPLVKALIDGADEIRLDANMWYNLAQLLQRKQITTSAVAESKRQLQQSLLRYRALLNDVLRTTAAA